MMYARRSILPTPEWVGDGFRIDIPGSYVLEWRLKHARDRIRHRREVGREVIPVATGVTFAVAPYIAGAAIVAFAPPWMKPLGVSMMVPTGVGEIFWFGVGYGVGKQFQQHIPDWML